MWAIWIMLPVNAAALLMLALKQPAHQAIFVSTAGLMATAAMSAIWPEMMTMSSLEDGNVVEYAYEVRPSYASWPYAVIFIAAGLLHYWLKRFGRDAYPARASGVQAWLLIIATSVPAILRLTPGPRRYADLESYTAWYVGISIWADYVFLASLVFLLAIAIWTIARRRHAL